MFLKLVMGDLAGFRPNSIPIFIPISFCIQLQAPPRFKQRGPFRGKDLNGEKRRCGPGYVGDTVAMILRSPVTEETPLKEFKEICRSRIYKQFGETIANKVVRGPIDNGSLRNLLFRKPSIAMSPIDFLNGSLPWFNPDNSNPDGKVAPPFPVSHLM
uniref:Uncharacterized protein n=1 Tax=Cannabis sativa TaxID=3483 RepID=A0A803QM85_CANSA